jgi:hypothetical protein
LGNEIPDTQEVSISKRTDLDLINFQDGFALWSCRRSFALAMISSMLKGFAGPLAMPSFHKCLNSSVEKCRTLLLSSQSMSASWTTSLADAYCPEATASLTIASRRGGEINGQFFYFPHVASPIIFHFKSHSVLRHRLRPEPLYCLPLRPSHCRRRQTS